MIIIHCRLLGTSGQNLDDIDLQSTIDTRVQILENCLKWNVIAPTCPDTLSKNSSFDCSQWISSGCYPYVKNDPFILTETPHVFFAGNQPKFETHLYQGKLLSPSRSLKYSSSSSGPNDIQVRLICIPFFSQSYSCVALNIRTLECCEISFENAELTMK